MNHSSKIYAIVRSLLNYFRNINAFLISIINKMVEKCMVIFLNLTDLLLFNIEKKKKSNFLEYSQKKN